jgi:hypothetical protein
MNKKTKKISRRDRMLVEKKKDEHKKNLISTLFTKTKQP